MTSDIIQHHEPFDFESYFKTIQTYPIGIDCDDYLRFMRLEGEKHSFMGSAECKDRIGTALGNAIASDEAVEVINRASRIMIAIAHSPETQRPVTMEETKFLTEFAADIPESCDIVWGFVNDPSLGDVVKVMMFVNTGE